MRWVVVRSVCHNGWFGSGAGRLGQGASGCPFADVRALAFPSGHTTIPPVSTLAEIESAVTQLPRPEQSELLRFLAALLRETATDETDYLMSSPANREHLLRVTEDIAPGRNIVKPDQAQFR